MIKNYQPPKDQPPLLSDEEYAGIDYDADCGQVICCDILPKYIIGEKVIDCYQELTSIITEFVANRVKAQREADIKWYNPETPA